MRRVTAYWYKGPEKVRIGELAQPRTGEIYFQWDKDFLKSPIELSPLKLPKQTDAIVFNRSRMDGLAGLFADHVPDGWGRILIRAARLEAGDLTELSPLDVLSYVGDRGMGALSFEPSLRSKETWADGKIDLDKLEKGIEPILSGTSSAVLEEFLAGGASPQGMRPKIILKEKGGKFSIGGEGLGTDEWIVKFRASIDPPEIGKLEYIYSLMAKDSGLPVPETKLFRTTKGFYFGTKRFDRTGEGRIHMHTLSGLLDTPPMNFSIGYDALATTALRLTQDAREVEKVFKLAVFNVLSCNQDDHTRNVAFLMDSEGKWRLAPAYDLVFHKSPQDQHKMAVGDKGKPTVKDLEAFGLDIGLTKAKVKRILDQTRAGVDGFKIYARKFDVPPKLTNDIVKGLGLLELKKGRGRR